MTVLQHYYTSCVKGTAGYSGFQIKAMSPGISSEDLKTINNMIGYSIPSSLDVNGIASHPIALRYNYIGAKKCILVCSQSNGTDENGRPGNFFAHSVIADVADFEVYPPIMFWRHPFWKNSDPSDRLGIPPEPAFNLTPSLEFGQIWPFLEVGKRREWFYKLLCAVLQYDTTKRPIVILDQNDNVALWIAAVTFALPNIYRRYLSFSTYHHDPYQAPYWITGTTSDSKFRFSRDEYISYFILNAVTNTISDCAPSRAADLICTNLRPDSYEDKLLEFFSMCNERLPEHSATDLSGKLEDVANLFLSLREKTLPVTEPAVQQSLGSFLDGFAARRNVQPQDLVDLTTAADLMLEALQSTPSPIMFDDYVKTLRVLSKSEPSFSQRCRKDMELVSSFLLRGRESLAEQLLSVCRDVYAQALLTQYVSQPSFISDLASRASASGCEVHCSIWKHLAPFIKIEESNFAQVGNLLRVALAAIGRLPKTDPLSPPAEAEKLLDILRVAIQSNSKVLWDNVIDSRQEPSKSILLWLYYLTVAKLSLADRVSYRKPLEAIEPELLVYEFKRDTRAAGFRGFIPLIEAWIKQTKDTPGVQSRLVSLGLGAFWSTLQEDQKNTLAEKMLSSDLLSAHIDDSWQGSLLASYLQGVKLRVLEPQVLHLYEKYYTYPGLDLRQQALIGGALAMTTGKFLGRSIPELQRWLESLAEPSYRLEADKLIQHFFARDSGIDAHIGMLQATYLHRYSDTFWESYWTHFRDLLLDTSRTTEFLELLAFWFDKSPGMFSGLSYLVQGFFLQLPAMLQETKEAKETAKDFQKAAHRINLQAAQEPWYPLIDQFFVEKKKKRLLGLL